MSDRLDKLINELRTMYDHIVIDSTPMFSVADANIINRVADLTLFVIRMGVQNRDFLPELERMYKDKRFKNLCIVVNDADINLNRYGSGYETFTLTRRCRTGHNYLRVVSQVI